MSVLVVDNEPAVLDGMLTLLTGWGCEVSTAGSDEEATARIGAARPDIVIADYHLDDGDGLTLIGRLRAVTGVELPALLVTADRSPALRDQAAALNVNVLNKPLKPAALRAVLTQWRATRVAAE
jgi:CheY-like chemotaxis protein